MRLEWTRRLPAPARRVMLARERWLLLVQDPHALCLWDAWGEPGIAWTRSRLHLVHLSETAQLILATDNNNRLVVLSAELELLWQRVWDRPLHAVAVAPLGQYLAVADEGGVTVLTEQGEPIWRRATPRALHHLAWVPETLALVGAADLGFVCCFDRAGTLLWQEGLPSHLGGVSVSGNGQETLLACFSDGIRRRSTERPGTTILNGSSPCRSLIASYSADVLITLALSGRSVERFERSSGSKQTVQREAAITAVASDAFGQSVVLATSAGELSLWLA
ncbi:MAG: hypothetical protein SNJ75_01295 [Gemmataceae bacterium]